LHVNLSLQRHLVVEQHYSLMGTLMALSEMVC
jgi:hypothetical protein